MSVLPEDFLSQMRQLLSDDEYERFVRSMGEKPFRGLRVNTLKCEPEKLKKFIPYIQEKTPFCQYGYYIPDEASGIGDEPFHHAGAFYVQEPSASSAVTVLDVQKGDRVLDLCAAPGGKSTQIAAELGGTGLLWSNEIVKSRANILLSNIERMGVPNAVVSNCHPDILCGRLSGYFDKVLADAPCSGEGMFRRDPGAVKSYMNYGPKVCVPLQESILEAADKCLKEGGSIVYSTCTFCADEDENQIKRFIERHPEYHVKAHPEIEGVTHGGEDSILPGSMRIWPHLSDGDGHFCVHIVKGEEKELKSASDLLITGEVRSKDKNVEAAMNVLDEVLSDKGREDILKGAFISHGTGIFRMTFDEKLFKGLKVVKTGLYVGDIKPLKSGKKVFEPSNSIALALDRTEIRDDSYLALSRGDDRLLKYLRGETISVSPEDGLKASGTILVGIGDYPLGFAKINGQTAKNMYPKAWRLI